MTQTHQGRAAIVTGAAQGIGRAIAALLAERGARVASVDLNPQDLPSAMVDRGAIAVTADVSTPDGWAHVVDETMKAFGRLDILVNNAALQQLAHIDTMTFEQWKRIFSVNLDAHFLGAKHVIPLMRQNRWGRIVSIASNSIGVPAPGLSHYMSTKMGAIGFVRGLANDLGGDAITVNAVLPSITRTPATDAMPEEFKREVWMQQAIKCFADPEDIAGPVAFLTSEDAAWITGQGIVVDGGMYKVS